MNSLARNAFLERIRIFNHTLDNNPQLIDKSLTDIDHNERARFLRNGLAIVAFNTLEDFIKNRIGEVLTIISTSSVSFNNLPIKIQEVTLSEALRGIHTVAKRKKENNQDWKLFIQQETTKLSSTSSSPFTLSSYSLGWEKSNLSSTDIPTFLKIFNVEQTWNNMQMITNTIGFTIPFTQQFFENAASRRHSAAHDPNAASSYSDLQSFGTSVMAFAAAFDLLLSQSARFILDNNSHYLAGNQRINAASIRIRYIKKVQNTYKEMSINNTIPIRTFSDLNAAITSLRGRLNYTNEFIVASDPSTNYLKWFTGF